MMCSSRASREHGESHTPIFFEDSALKCYHSRSKVSALRGFLVLYRQVESKEVAGINPQCVKKEQAAADLSPFGLT